MDATTESLMEMERAGGAEQERHEVGEGAPECRAPDGIEAENGGGVEAAEPASEPVDETNTWRERAEAAESQAAELGDRLGAVEAAAEDLRRMVSESERARQIDRELLIAGVVDLDGARSVVEAQMGGGSTVHEAVARLRERRPQLFAPRVRGLRATALPAGAPGVADSAGRLAEAARETGDRRLLLRYLRTRRGEQ